MYTKFSLIKFDKKSYDYLVIIAMPHCVDAIIFGEKLKGVKVVLKLVYFQALNVLGGSPTVD